MRRRDPPQPVQPQHRVPCKFPIRQHPGLMEISEPMSPAPAPTSPPHVPMPAMSFTSLPLVSALQTAYWRPHLCTCPHSVQHRPESRPEKTTHFHAATLTSRPHPWLL